MTASKTPSKTEAAISNLSLQVHTMITQFSSMRAGLSAWLGYSHRGERDLYQQFGYPRELTIQEFLGIYLRNDIANRIIHAFPRATWREVPVIRDDKGDGIEEGKDNFSPFASACDSFFSKNRIYSAIERADRMSSIGQFGLLVFGFRDGKRMHEPLEKGKYPFLYARAYDQSQITINTWEQNEQSPRYGLPLTYTVQRSVLSGEAKSQTKSINIHHSRAIHIAEFLDQDDVYGTPRLMPVYNRLKDLEKVMGGSAETFWLNSRPGLGVFADKESDFSPADIEDMKTQLNEFEHKLRRTLAMKGVTAQNFSSQVADPEPNVSTLLDLIAGTVGIPKRILIGSERGELSSDQDENNWSSRIAERREMFATPSVLMPVVDLMIHTQNIPEPEGDYWVEWPDIASDPVRAANLALTRTQALVSYANSPAAEMYVPKEEFRTDFLGLPPESEYEIDYDDELIEDPLLLEQPPDQAPEEEEEDDKEEDQPKKPLSTMQDLLKARMTPQSLYVFRPVLNGAEIVEWARGHGIDNIVSPDDMHVTIAYSRKPIDWMSIPDCWSQKEDGTVHIPRGGARVTEKLGNAYVISFTHNELKWRWQEIKEAGATWDHVSYQPHITFSYDIGDLDPMELIPFEGPIILGPEVFRIIDEDWESMLIEEAVEV